MAKRIACLATFTLAMVLSGCGFSPDAGKAVSRFGIVDQTVPNLDCTTGTIPQERQLSTRR